jgi:hypothetical protein
MAILMVKHTVQDFKAWKTVFDSMADYKNQRAG